MLTLALVMGGHAHCDALGVSGPLALVVAGLAIGSVSRRQAMSDTTRAYLEKFWEAPDEALKAVLFVLKNPGWWGIDFNSFYLGLGVAVLGSTCWCVRWRWPAYPAARARALALPRRCCC